MSRESARKGGTAAMTNSIAEQLAHLKAQRAALDDQINLIESGISKAAYEGNLAWQLSVVNDQRIADGKSPLTMSAFLAADDEAQQ
jgi:hypothetical protein